MLEEQKTPTRRFEAGPLFENVGEATAACLITMVQGNVLLLGLGHWIIASQTGVAAGILATVAIWLSGGRGRWVVAGVLTVATAVIDYVVHPGGFGPVIAEAVVTGLGAGALSLLVSAVRGRWRARAPA